MPDYIVKWEIDIFDAKSPEDAAHQALEIQRDPESIANIFTVTNKTTNKTKKVDLWK